jgi:membrane protein YqaA with SNARE-associated domain
MHDLLFSYGYPALFLLSFLAATLIPLGSEWLLIAMVLQHHNPTATVAVATVGNYLGAVTSYLIGCHGSHFLTARLLRMDKTTTDRAERLFGKYGSWSLLFTWLPVVGDPLCLIGGVLRIPFDRFSLLVVTGKAVRYAAVAWVTLNGVKIFST